MLSRADRYDVKGKKYFDYPSKYYCTDVGLRNIRLGLRQQEETHILENILYNELLYRGYSVDVGVVEVTEKNEEGKRSKKTLEIDFIARKGTEKYYIQSALSMDDTEKQDAELKSLRAVRDLFKKLVISKSYGKSWVDDEGIYEDPAGNWHELDRAVVALIIVTAYALIRYIRIKVFALKAVVIYIPTMALTFLYVFLRGLTDELAPTAYRDIFINYTVGFGIVTLIAFVIQVLVKHKTVEAIIDGTGPLSTDGTWGRHMQFTSNAMRELGQINGPRCCKRDAMIAFKNGIEYVNNHYDVKLEYEHKKCEYSNCNEQCIKEKCPYYG